MPHLVVMAAGTGGHVIPGLAVAREMQRRGWSVSWLGTAQGKGYQLTHSLIALGRGEIFGQGLGNSVEKLHYLPEAHTDFLLAVIGEELGFVGVAAVILLFFWLTRRVFAIGRQAIALDRVFAGLLCQGIGVGFGFQAFINMGVNLGVLPTKGLTLPLISSGGSSVMMTFLALGIVFRIRYELDRDAPFNIAREPNLAGVRR